MPAQKPRIVLDLVLRVMQPLARLLIRSGVTYPAFAGALKRVFLDAARAELAAKGMPQTDSAVTLLCGVHRRDVRLLSRQEAVAGSAIDEPLGLAAQVVWRWVAEHPRAQRKPLPRSEFDALVAAISSDVRPRAMLDELVRLGVARESEGGVELVAEGFAPRQGFEETAALVAANLRDHADACAANLLGQSNFLEQAMFVDGLSPDSALQLERAAMRAWQQSLEQVMPEAQQRYDADAGRPPDQARHRARFGVYFYSHPEDSQ